MNRDFFIAELTPAIARNIVRVMPSSQVYIDPKILAMAKTNALPITDPVLTPIVQFIHDHDLRCVIPFEGSAEIVREAIWEAIPKDRRIIFIDEPIHWNRRIKARLSCFSAGSNEQYQFITPKACKIEHFLGERDAVIVMRYKSEANMQWLAKINPNFILYCEYEHQFSLNQRNASISNSAFRAATVINTALEAIDTNLVVSRGIERALPLCSVYMGLIKEKQQIKPTKK